MQAGKIKKPHKRVGKISIFDAIYNITNLHKSQDVIVSIVISSP